MNTLAPPPVSAWLLIVPTGEAIFVKFIIFESVNNYFVDYDGLYLSPVSVEVWEEYPSCLLIALLKLNVHVIIIGRGCGLILIDTPTHSETSDW